MAVFGVLCAIFGFFFELESFSPGFCSAEKISGNLVQLRPFMKERGKGRGFSLHIFLMSKCRFFVPPPPCSKQAQVFKVPPPPPRGNTADPPPGGVC